MSDQDMLQPVELTKITDEYLKALGRITVEFSRLESRLLAGTGVLLDTSEVEPTFIVIAQLPFARLLYSFCLLFDRRYGQEKDVGAKLKAFQKATQKAEELRNRAAHSIWALPQTVGEPAIRRKYYVTQKPAYREDEHAMSVEDVNAIADEIKAAGDASEPLFDLIHEQYFRPAGFRAPEA